VGIKAKVKAKVEVEIKEWNITLTNDKGFSSTLT
jgi:hypothetical protein